MPGKRNASDSLHFTVLKTMAIFSSLRSSLLLFMITNKWLNIEKISECCVTTTDCIFFLLAYRVFNIQAEEVCGFQVVTSFVEKLEYIFVRSDCTQDDVYQTLEEEHCCLR